MRIANNKRLLKRVLLGASAMLLVALVVIPMIDGISANAADSSPIAAVPALPAAANASPSAAFPNGVPPANDNMPPLPSASAMPGMAANAPMRMAALPPPQPAQPSGGSETARNVGKMEDRLSENAKGAVRNLENSTDDATLEDLNTARQTVARIEAMIEVEKRLSELEKIRSERIGGGHSVNSIASALPASALAPLPMPPVSAAPLPAPAPVVAKPVEKEKPKSMLGSIDISRISGSDGKYTAVLKVNGELKPVRVGDTIGDHVTVRWISSSSVLIEENGETHTLRIRNVDAIYSAMR